jgi:hypothetical protein
VQIFTEFKLDKIHIVFNQANITKKYKLQIDLNEFLDKRKKKIMNLDDYEMKEEMRNYLMKYELKKSFTYKKYELK